MDVSTNTDPTWDTNTTWPREYYNPERIIDLVEQHLRDQGLHPERVTGGVALRQGGAARLLRGLGIQPAGGVEMIDRPNAPDEW